ncbi:MAG TPA: hypothetical protein VEJ20_09490 [Candidatus Eremiobacteraceae bacterium]|nr:hypothetical protein [Candidatus Eremiobacteraceae bacterium]
MSWSHREVRRMLAALDRPHELERSVLAVAVKDALGLDSVRDAVLHVVYRTFGESSQRSSLLRDVILMSDLNGEKRTLVASALNLSTRTFFRQRAAAIEMVAATIEQVLNVADPRTDFKYETARMIGAVKPHAVEDFFEREAHRMGGEAAYAAVLVSVRNGRPAPQSLLDQCTGHWRLLAELEIAQTHLNGDDPDAYRRIHEAVRASLDAFKGTARERLEFELAYVERLDAMRRCDVEESGRATAVLAKSTAGDFRLRTLASICQAEQACDENDLAAAKAMIHDVQGLAARINDFRISGRASHAASVICLLEGDFTEARDLSRLSLAALDRVEPSFAPCASAVEGRAQLWLREAWVFPVDLRERFPHSYVTALLEAVAARHLAASDANAASALAERAARNAAMRQARGVLAYAQGAHAIASDLLGLQVEAQRERVSAWESGVALRRPFYLHDFLVHAALPERALGAFELDDDFVAAIARRLVGLTETPARGGIDEPIAASLVVEALCMSLDGAARERALALRRHQAEAEVFTQVHATAMERAAIVQSLRRLAIELSYCLPFGQRPGFVERFSDAAAVLGDDAGEAMAQTGYS